MTRELIERKVQNQWISMFQKFSNLLEPAESQPIKSFKVVNKISNVCVVFNKPKYVNNLSNPFLLCSRRRGNANNLFDIGLIKIHENIDKL